MEIQGVTESIEHQLRQEIITGALGPGSRLNEIELSERLGVSRPPLREAFRKLESENLVVSFPRKGSYVAQMSMEDCTQIYRARIMLECAAIEIIGEQGGADLGLLAQTMDAELRYPPPGNPATNMLDYFNVMSDFHNKLVEACKNRWILHYHSQLRPTMARYQMMYLRLPGTRQTSLAEHGEVIELIRGGNYPAAQQKITQHILKTHDALIKGITVSLPAPLA
jgi:DNA-binding GntR family transcriptional regulator